MYNDVESRCLRMMNENVKPGIHPCAQTVIDTSFLKKEKEIARYWGNEWYITNAGFIEIGQSAYRYFLIKPTATYEESLSLSREVIVILSPYSDFEPRTLEAYEEVYKIFHDHRLERICYVLISGDNDIETHLASCLSNQESQLIIPFTYDSIRDNRGNPNFIRNQFRKYFYSRDLFDFSEPLKKDFYFFGRNDLTVSIIEKHRANQNFGLFGLRKTGKTSIVYDVIRKLPQKDSLGVLIDCQNTSFNFRRWNYALYYVLLRSFEEADIEFSLNEAQFTEADAAYLFEKSISELSKTISKNILLLFDEIENITFGKSGVEHWCNGLDFVYFWQSVRSAFQHTTNIFSFCILGTNSKCIEVPIILEKDNPIFNAFQPRYIPGFDQGRTREMVRKLGRLMGIRFDEGVYTRLTEDYGGHPFLIRQVCSAIAKKYPQRPVQIDRLKYIAVRDEFNRENDYFNMLLEVLKQFYVDEYEMLNLLASGDLENFKYFADQDYSMVKHLIGYGIVRASDESYDFQIDALKEYLLRQQRRSAFIKTPKEKWAYTCTQRSALEIELRKMVKFILRIAYQSESLAKEAVVKKIYGSDARKYATYSYSDLFDSRKSNIYFKNLKDLINSNWDYFKDFWNKQEMFISAMDILNNEGRFDAHATIPEEDEIVLINAALNTVEKGLEKYKQAFS